MDFLVVVKEEWVIELTVTGHSNDLGSLSSHEPQGNE